MGFKSGDLVSRKGGCGAACCWPHRFVAPGSPSPCSAESAWHLSITLNRGRKVKKHYPSLWLSLCEVHGNRTNGNENLLHHKAGLDCLLHLCTEQIPGPGVWQTISMHPAAESMVSPPCATLRCSCIFTPTKAELSAHQQQQSECQSSHRCPSHRSGWNE